MWQLSLASIPGGLIPLLAAAAVLTACGEQQRDLRDFSSDLTSGDLGGVTYEAFDRLRDRGAGSSFDGYPCLTPCSAHAAGYGWAQDQADISEDDCKRQSWGFMEGCIAFMAETGAFDGPTAE
jgi:hypothetical protein